MKYTDNRRLVQGGPDTAFKRIPHTFLMKGFSQYKRIKPRHTNECTSEYILANTNMEYLIYNYVIGNTNIIMEKTKYFFKTRSKVRIANTVTVQF